MRCFIGFCVLFIVLFGSVSLADDISQAEKVSAVTEKIPYKDSRISSNTSYAKVVMVFIFLMAVLVAAVFFLMRTSLHKKLGNLQGRRINLLESKRVSTKLSLHLVSVDERKYILADSNNGVALQVHEASEQLGAEVETSGGSNV